MDTRTALALITIVGSIAGLAFSLTGQHAASAVCWGLVFLGLVGRAAERRRNNRNSR